MRVKLLLLAFTFLLIVLRAKARESDIINWATYVEPPYANFVDGKVVGIHGDIIGLIAQKLNVRVKFIHCPFVSCLSLMNSGNTDLIIGVKLTAERPKDSAYITHP